MISIVDYGMGNLRSVSKGVEKVGGKFEITRDPDAIRKSDAVILPGVGAFARCMDNLTRFGLAEVVKEFIKSGKPFLGICLGLQMLFEESEEFGPVKGLGVLPGRVVRFPESPDLAVPHMGWNRIIKRGNPKLLENIDDGEWFYFVHSYYVVPANAGDIATETDYGIKFVSSIARDNIFASQFHPEKSAKIGLRLLENFVRISGVKK